MKRINFFAPARLLVALFALAALTFTACQESELTGSLAAEELDVALDEVADEATFDDIDLYAVEAMDMTDPVAEAREFDGPGEQLLSQCATVTHDSVAKTVTIDFGTGCTGPDGKTRSGQILITYTQRLYRSGASLSIVLQNYVVDGVAIAGTKTLTNVTQGPNGYLSMNTTLTGGSKTWPDGTVATREYTRTRTWVRANRPINDEFVVRGGARGIRANGQDYQIRSLAPLVYKRRCKVQGVRIPVEGTIGIRRSGHPDVTIDFGDGTCDWLVTVTANGNSQTVDFRTLRN